MIKPFNRNNNFRGKRDLHKINNFITSEEVRVILDDGEQLGVMKKNEAIDIAKGRGLDLVEIAPNNKPPVCKVVDYGKVTHKHRDRHTHKHRYKHRPKHTHCENMSL